MGGQIILYNSMQSPVKLNKINPKLSGSRREQKSYAQRHKNKGKSGIKSYSPGLSPQESYHQADISSRGERIMELVAVGGDIENIRIEEEIDEYQTMKSQFMETEILWSKKISQTKNEINDIRQSIKGQQKVIKEMEKQLSSKRSRLITLQDKLTKSKQALSAIPEQNYQQPIDSLQQQYDQIHNIGQKSIFQAKSECSQLQAQNDGLDKDINQLERQIQLRSAFSDSNYNQTLTTLLEQQQAMQREMRQMSDQMEQISNNMKQKQKQLPIKEQVHRKYLQLYQKMFMNKQLDKMVSLIDYKDEQIKRFELYGKNKIRYREKMKQIEDLSTDITRKKLQIAKLEQEIKSKSTILLNLYHVQSLR